MATLTVGSTSTYKTLSAAVAASSAGDTIMVSAGTYTNDWTTIKHSLTIVGVGEVNFVATTTPPNEKGIILIDGGDVTFDNLNFSGVYVSGLNGAPIVQNTPGDLTVKNCDFSDSQQAIRVGGGLDTFWYGSDVVVDNCTFKNLGSEAGHGLYISSAETLTVTNSEFSDIHIRHAVKSRALNTTVKDCTFEDGDTGTASYFIDIPQSGNAVISGNTFNKGANASNPNIISYAAEQEKTQYPDSSLTVTNNTFVSSEDYTNAVRNHSTTVTAQLSGNSYEGTIVNHAKGLYEETSIGEPVPTTNVAPVAGDDTASVESGKAVTVKVLANDSDDNGDTLTVSSVGSAANGTTKLNADGTVTYTANASFSGSDSFTYTVSDGHGGSDTAKVTVGVTAPATSGTTVSKSTSYTLSSSETNLVLTGTSKINGTGNSLNNTITGNDNANVLSGAGGNDTLYGGGGNDTLDGGSGTGNDVLDGGAGNDRLFGNGGADMLTGGTGSDTFVFKQASHSLPAAPTTINDFSTAQGDKIELVSFDANPSVSGTQTFSFIGTGAFSGTAGQLRYSAQGSDLLVQADTNGDKAADFAVLVKNATSLSASDFTGATNATGSTTQANTVSSSTSYTLVEPEQNLILTGTSGISGTGNSLDNKITGNDAGNTLSGNSGGDSIDGAGGNDYINGGYGSDTLVGGAGNDELVGNWGPDTLTGGTGSDTFTVWSVEHSAPGKTDTITDFSSLQGDKVNLNTIDANSTVSSNQNFTFIGSNAFGKQAGEVRYVGTTSGVEVQADVNGDGVSDMSVSLTGITKLVAGDFML